MNKTLTLEPAPEEIFSVAEVAAQLRLSTRTIRRKFQDWPGVLIHGQSFNSKKRGYQTLLIPKSVLQEVCDSMRVRRKKE